MSPSSRARLVGGFAAALAAGGATVVVLARRWKRRTLARLRRNAAVAPTPSGPLEYAVAGAGAPIVVFHGSPGGYDQGLALGQSLGGGFRVIAVSRPGYLGTPLATGRTPAGQADAVAALLDHLEIPAAAVVAASGGGPAALELVRRHRHRVSRLVLWQAASRATGFDPGVLGSGFMATDVGAWLMLTGLRVAPAAVFPAAIRSAAARRRVRGVVATLVPIDVRREGMENDAAILDALRENPLGDIAVPTLVVHGSADTDVPYAQALEAAWSIPGARLVTIEGGTHDTVLFDTRALEAIARFLREAPGAVDVVQADADPAPRSAGGVPGPWRRWKRRVNGRTEGSTHAQAFARVRTSSFRTSSSVLSARSYWSVLSWVSVLSVASAASILSVGSFASILSLGSFGSILSVGSSTSILSIGSSGAILSIGRCGTART